MEKQQDDVRKVKRMDKPESVVVKAPRKEDRLVKEQYTFVSELTDKSEDMLERYSKYKMDNLRTHRRSHSLYFKDSSSKVEQWLGTIDGMN